MVKGNRVQLRVERVISKGRNESVEETGFCCGLESSAASAGIASRSGQVWQRLEFKLAYFQVAVKHFSHERYRDFPHWWYIVCACFYEFTSDRVKTVNTRNRCKLNVCAPGHELVLGCLTGRITAKGSLQANASRLWQWTWNVLGHLAGMTEGRFTSGFQTFSYLASINRMNWITREREVQPRRSAQEGTKWVDRMCEGHTTLSSCGPAAPQKIVIRPTDWTSVEQGHF